MATVFDRERAGQAEQDTKAYQEGLPLCQELGLELIKVTSTGPPFFDGLRRSAKALGVKDAPRRKAKPIHMGILDTNRGSVFLYYSEKLAALVDPEKDEVLCMRKKARTLRSWLS